MTGDSQSDSSSSADSSPAVAAARADVAAEEQSTTTMSPAPKDAAADSAAYTIAPHDDSDWVKMLGGSSSATSASEASSKPDWTPSSWETKAADTKVEATPATPDWTPSWEKKDESQPLWKPEAQAMSAKASVDDGSDLVAEWSKKFHSSASDTTSADVKPHSATDSPEDAVAHMRALFAKDSFLQQRTRSLARHSGLISVKLHKATKP